MAEVFTISGPLGVAAACPPGWKATKTGACGAPKGRSPAAVALQNALKALGVRARDSALARIVADGYIGAGTAAAVNRTFTTHIGPGQAPAEYRTGRFTPFQVAQFAGPLTALINAETARRGAAPPIEAQPRTAVCPVGWKATASRNCVAAAGSAIQRALQTLGRAVRDPALIKLKVDGVIGPGTVAVVNRALTTHIGPGQAPAALRTGRLTVYEVAANAAAIVQAVNAEAARRGVTSAPAVSMAAACPTGWRLSGKGNCSAPVAKTVQNALLALGRAVRDPVLLKISADGVIGPGTTSAVNRAFMTHVGPGQAPAGLRTGRLTTYRVAANAAAIVQAINSEIVRRGAARAEVPPTTVAAVCPPGWKATRAGYCSGPAAAVLQRALAALGKATGDPVLRKVTADGVIGPGTIAAVNRALTTHIGPGQAPAALRTGTLTKWTIAQNSDALTQLVSTEARRRGVVAPPVTPPPVRERPPKKIPPEVFAPPDDGGPPGPPIVDDRELPIEPPTPPGPDGRIPDGEGPPGPPAAEAKPFPWKWVAIGGGVLAVGGIAFAMARRKRGSEGGGRGGSREPSRPSTPPQRAKTKPAPAAGSLGALSARDFRDVANVLCQHDAPPALVGGFSRWLATHNPRFDRGRFEHAATSCRR